MLLGLSKEGYFLGDFWKISLGPTLHFFSKCGIGWPWENCHNLAIRALFEPLFCAKIFSSLCTISAYYLEDNVICARVLLGLSSKGYVLDDFWKISVGPPFALFQKMWVLGGLAKMAITSLFRQFWSRCLRQTLLQSLFYKCILNRGYCHLRQTAFRPCKWRLLFWRFLKNFPWSPLCTFPGNAGFGWPFENYHNLAIRALFAPLFCPKIFSSLWT